MLEQNAITEEQKQIARLAKALGHPIRIAILEMLSIRHVAIMEHVPECFP